ncbi:MAG TPA: cobalt ECF transporter T component CbiQ [Verrucomicrobia bacterium]|nr:cobalt ECF transporter T component CbiQ [Verrucomicrobiota bacterium]HOB31953.1 cobalt ECF transporter T component CbiQ [Verrucomicrobiota bacterium]HOP97711.1 cobalt ECF transporter T component CbiQ [Verrucomicrobiota bacterium]HPU57005.1 cobalt ECF transporter T component CbiQ [Verrucomicrobiota bacterium]
MSWLPHSHFTHSDSIVHRMRPDVKLACAFALILATALAPGHWTAWYAAVFALLTGATLVSRVPLKFVIQRLLLLSPFILAIAAVNAFHPDVRTPWQVVAAKSLLSLLAVLLVTLTTPFGKILQVLRRAKVPALLITTMALMHRYLFVLADESERMQRARLSRTFRKRKGIWWRLSASVVSQLFVRASQRAERIYDAMCARGWK